MRLALLALCLVVLLAPGHASAHTVAVEVDLLAPTAPMTGSRAGLAIAIDGDRALVGIPGAFGASGGAVVAFSRTGGAWTLDQTITDPDTDTTGDTFGWSVALSGTVAVIGAPGDGGSARPGGAWRFERTGGTTPWVGTRLVAPGGTPAQFGTSVAISASFIVVGAPATESSMTTGGAVVVYANDGTGAVLVSDAATVNGDLFGTSVAVSGNTLLVGAPSNDHTGTNAGAAYAFDLVGSTWTPAATPFQPLGTSDYGRSVALSMGGLLAAVGAPQDSSDGVSGGGAAYVYQRAALGPWPDVGMGTTLVGTNRSPSDFFGSSVALSGTDLVVGAPYDEDGAAMDAGSAYLFSLRASSWVEVARFHASGGAAADRLGTSVAVSGTTVLAGVPRPAGRDGFAAVFPFPQADGAMCTISDRCESSFCVMGTCAPFACGATECDGGAPPDLGGMGVDAAGMDGSSSGVDSGPRAHVHISGCKCAVGVGGDVPRWALVAGAFAAAIAARRRKPPKEA